MGAGQDLWGRSDGAQLGSMQQCLVVCVPAHFRIPVQTALMCIPADHPELLSSSLSSVWFYSQTMLRLIFSQIVTSYRAQCDFLFPNQFAFYLSQDCDQSCDEYHHSLPGIGFSVRLPAPAPHTKGSHTHQNTPCTGPSPSICDLALIPFWLPNIFSHTVSNQFS